MLDKYICKKFEFIWKSGLGLSNTHYFGHFTTLCMKGLRFLSLTISWQWFLYDRDLRRERVNHHLNFSLYLAPIPILSVSVYFYVDTFQSQDFLGCPSVIYHLLRFLYRSSYHRCSMKRLSLETSENSQENTSSPPLFFNKKRDPGFPVNFAKFLTTLFLQNTSRGQLLSLSFPFWLEPVTISSFLSIDSNLFLANLGTFLFWAFDVLMKVWRIARSWFDGMISGPWRHTLGSDDLTIF